MATSHSSETARGDSPDPSSHAANIYDVSGVEGEWLDETEDDDDIFEPTTDESEDAEFFDPSEDVDADFHGIVLSYCISHADGSPSVATPGLFANLCIWCVDAEDGMSGVEIEFSVENEESGTQDSDRRSEVEAGDSRRQASTTTRRSPSRRQGQWHCDPT